MGDAAHSWDEHTSCRPGGLPGAIPRRTFIESGTASRGSGEAGAGAAGGGAEEASASSSSRGAEAAIRSRLGGRTACRGRGEEGDMMGALDGGVWQSAAALCGPARRQQ